MTLEQAAHKCSQAGAEPVRRNDAPTEPLFGNSNEFDVDNARTAIDGEHRRFVEISDALEQCQRELALTN